MGGSRGRASVSRYPLWWGACAGHAGCHVSAGGRRTVDANGGRAGVTWLLRRLLRRPTQMLSACCSITTLSTSPRFVQAVSASCCCECQLLTRGGWDSADSASGESPQQNLQCSAVPLDLACPVLPTHLPAYLLPQLRVDVSVLQHDMLRGAGCSSKAHAAGTGDPPGSYSLLLGSCSLPSLRQLQSHLSLCSYSLPSPSAAAVSSSAATVSSPPRQLQG